MELSGDCALPESLRERKGIDKRSAMLAAALGKSISGPPENLFCPRDRTVLHLIPAEALGPVTAKPVCPVPSFCTGRMNALRQGRKRKLPQLWGLLAWKLNRAARAQRYQVPESPR